MTRTKTYEVMLLLDNREVKKGWDELKTQIDGVLTKHGAKVVVAKRWDERKLAYEIKKQRRATYYLSYLEAEPNSLVELERTLRLTQPVLRHLVLACEEIPGEAYEPEREFDLDKAEDEESSTSEAKDGEESSSSESSDAEASDSDATESEESESSEGEGAGDAQDQNDDNEKSEG